ncbi:hypothetical protein ABZ639_30770 [Saccharomonospora sp. NPDC006951]
MGSNTIYSAAVAPAKTWHRPMTHFAAAMGVAAVLSAVGLVVDDRMLLGAPIWLKPFKFAVSIAVYCLTWAWLTSLLPSRRRRVANRISAALIVLLAIEYLIIVVQAARGTTSHFNFTTPFNAVLFSIMGASIALLWTGTLALTVLLLKKGSNTGDHASTLAIRLGAVISLAGLALGALMTSPTADQTAQTAEGGLGRFIGAHTVGSPDGGPGMPITNWSTTDGDLRIPHFVGMHALQVLPLLALGLAVLARRVPWLRRDLVRTRLVLIGGAGYAGLVALVTWQALRGQPLTGPDALTTICFALLGAGVALATASTIRAARRQETHS